MTTKRPSLRLWPIAVIVPSCAETTAAPEAAKIAVAGARLTPVAAAAPTVPGGSPTTGLTSDGGGTGSASNVSTPAVGSGVPVNQSGPSQPELPTAGDVTAAEVKADAVDTYGKIAPRAEIAARRRPLEPVQDASRTVTLADARIEQPSLSRAYLVPSRTSAKPGTSEALEVLAHILGGGENSRLYRSLVVEQVMATSAGAFYSATALDYGKFGIYATPRSGKSLHDVEAAIHCGDRGRDAGRARAHDENIEGPVHLR